MIICRIKPKYGKKVNGQFGYMQWNFVAKNYGFRKGKTWGIVWEDDSCEDWGYQAYGKEGFRKKDFRLIETLKGDEYQNALE